MTWAFLTDEHVPSVFITCLSSRGYEVVTARSALAAGADDQSLLEYAAERDLVLITHDRSDFAELAANESHAGIVIYTDRTAIANEPEATVRVLERALRFYSPAELRGEEIWLNEWR